MPDMKYSGIEWIGSIPKDWKINRLKYDINCYDGKRIPIDASLREEGPYPYWGAGSVMDYVNDYIFNEEIVLLGEDGAPFFDEYRAVAFLINEPVWVNNHIHVIKGNKNIINKYLTYFLNIVKYDVYINGSIINKLTQGNMNNINITLPKLKEQQLIVDFLDCKISKIDNILEDLNSQIELLNYYKKSLIKETVTKGLSTNVKMKKSDIDWIGDIPKHWDIYYLKHLFKMFAGGDVDEYDFSEEYSAVTPYPIYSNSLENDGLYGYMSKYRFSGNTFTVTGRGDVGKAISRNNKYYPIVRLLVCVPIFEDDTRYYSYCVNSADLLGEQTAMAQLTTQKLGINKFPRPPIDEQKKIADYLDIKCKEIDDLIKNKQEQIEKMKQYKKSLIYEYVTGKKRVKGAEELYG